MCDDERGREDVRLLMAKCRPRKMRFVGMVSHCPSPIRVHVRSQVSFTAPHRQMAPSTHADERDDRRNTTQAAKNKPKPVYSSARAPHPPHPADDTSKHAPGEHPVLDRVERDGVDDAVHARREQPGCP